MNKEQADKINAFLEFESNQKKSIRGGVEMYDIKGHYKFLSLSELFDYWCNNYLIKTETGWHEVPPHEYYQWEGMKCIRS